jgi:hypothetical protein
MKRAVQYANEEGQARQAHIEFPKRCPVCNLLMTLGASATTFSPSTKGLQATFLCNNEDCKSWFIAYYQDTGAGQVFDLHKFEPPNLTQPSFPDFVKEISPKFLEIYKQAHEANERGLDHVAGPGYRKAFEFLIKDYAKSIDITKTDEIEQAFAGDIVSDFISDLRVQAVARRALWLGNDEVHYIRRWVDFDVNDLINLIQLTIDWIEIERESKSYVESMKTAAKTKAAET